MGKSMIIKLKKGKKRTNFYKSRIKFVKQDEKYYYFMQDDVKIVNLEWRLRNVKNAG